MFDTLVSGVGLSPGEGHDVLDDETHYQLTLQELASQPVEEQHCLPSGIETWTPGPYVAVVVGSVDRTRLNGHDAVRLMVTEARLASHHEAGKLATMTEVAFSPPGGPASPPERSPNEIEYAAYEIGSALGLTRRSAQAQLDRSLSLTGRLRRVWERFRTGQVDEPRMRVFHRELDHLSTDTVDTVLDQILDDAPGLTTGQLQRRVSRLVMAADPNGSDLAYEAGHADRKFVASANPDNTGNVTGSGLAPTDVAAIGRKVNRLARQLSKLGDGRTMDQIRADIFVDLLLATNHHRQGLGGEVIIQTDLATLVELADNPGELAGYAPVVADITRQTVAQLEDAKWSYQVFDDNGNPVATGTTRRRPDAETVRQVRADYQTCVGIGCRMDSYTCDLDHRRAHTHGGPTCKANLAPLCRHHHMIKHRTNWKLIRTENGEHLWTSPLGHTYHVPKTPPFG